MNSMSSLTRVDNSFVTVATASRGAHLVGVSRDVLRLSVANRCEEETNAGKTASH